MKKDIKKSSYYVWFLGAEEAKGLRGAEYMIPVIRNLIEREKEIEPYKVTLQVSHKGLKIVQNLPINNIPISKPDGKCNSKTDVVKHFIPHHAVTSVLQEEDIVSCILLLYNPFTKCPVHVHAYRCDSIETAEILCGQLQTLLERPDNQKKLEEIETRLKAKGLISPNPSSNRNHKKIHSPNSGGSSSSARDSDLSGGSSSSDRLSGETRIANLYDSLAAELKEKLNVGQQHQAPLLLPPRDYDTVHRQKGNLSGIDFRRCLNMNIVGMNAAKNKRSLDLIASNQSSTVAKHAIANSRTKIGSSGGSSGIGSDHAPSPDQECDARYLDNQSTSDEEWNAEHINNTSLFLVQTGHHPHDWQSKELSLPRARRHNSSSFESNSIPSPNSPKVLNENEIFKKKFDEDIHGYDSALYKSNKSPRSIPSDYDKKQKFLDEIRGKKQNVSGKYGRKSDLIGEIPNNNNNKKRSPEDRQRSPSPDDVSPKERFKDAKEKFLLLERERLEEQERLMQMNMERKRNAPAVQEPMMNGGIGSGSQPKSSRRYHKNGDFEKEFVDRTKYNMHRQASLESDYDKDIKRRSIAKAAYYRNKSMESLNSEDYPSLASSGGGGGGAGISPGNKNYENSLHLSRTRINSSYNNTDDERIDNYNRMSRYHSSEMTDVENNRRRRYASPVSRSANNNNNNSRSYSDDYLPEHGGNMIKYREIARSQQSVPFAEDTSIPLQRYRSPTRPIDRQPPPRNYGNSALPPTAQDEDIPPSSRRLGRNDSRYHSRLNDDVEIKRRMLETVEDEKRRNRIVETFEDEKRRNRVLETIENEKRRNSNEIAKELKRRSYQDHRPHSELSYHGGGGPPIGGGYNLESEDRDRYPVDQEMPRMYHNKVIRNGRNSPTNHTSGSPRYRHSYAEPFRHNHHPPISSHHHDLLHRTNSSLSSGRIGIAAIHHGY